MENKLMVPGQARTFVSILGAVVVILAVLAAIAGLPSGDRAVGFVVGLIVLIAALTGIGLLGWHLLVRPLPANLPAVTQAQPLLSTRARQIIALYLTLGTVSIGIAGVWDEIWHVKYGIPFGEDFFWRPHLMLYFGLSTLIVIGLYSGWVLQTRGKGTLQQRFRANPLLGISFLGGLFTFYAVGADPIWHRLYGGDIAPWSVPHLLILVLIYLMGLLGIVYHKSLMPPREWQFKLTFAPRDVLITLVLVGALVDYLLIFTIQWYAAASSERQMQQVTSYPDWLLPAFITFLVTFFGATALHATRRIGSATLVGLLAFAVRFLLDTSLGGVRAGTVPLWLIVPLLLTLDIWYAIAIRRTGKPLLFWMTAGVIAVAYGVIGLPITARLFPYLALTPANIPGMMIASAITAAGSVWLAQLLGSMGHYEGAETASVQTSQSAMLPAWVNGLLYVVFVAFVVFFVATATPPV